MDVASVDPESDGRFIYGPQKIYEMDYSKPPGKDWRLKAYTRDTLAYPDDLRRANGEYLLVVEEDFRAKNLVYRWKP